MGLRAMVESGLSFEISDKAVRNSDLVGQRSKSPQATSTYSLLTRTFCCLLSNAQARLRRVHCSHGERPEHLIFCCRHRIQLRRLVKLSLQTDWEHGFHTHSAHAFSRHSDVFGLPYLSHMYPSRKRLEDRIVVDSSRHFRWRTARSCRCLTGTSPYSSILSD